MSRLAGSRDKTITDFGEQWTRYQENEGYYASLELLDDIINPLVSAEELRGLECVEIGAGTGRISTMLLNAGAKHVTAVEPSRAFEVLRQNLEPYGDRVTCVQARGDELPAGSFDIAVSIGVLHHIPEPSPVVQAVLKSLRPDGRVLIWLYGAEGNSLYRTFFEPLRLLTRRLPLKANEAIAWVLYGVAMPYALLTQWLPFLPLSGYLKRVFLKFDRKTRVLAIIDQINPQWAEYYTRDRAERLLSENGFVNVKSHHRHGYSWTVTGTKP